MRRRHSAADRERFLAELERSGDPVRMVADRIGVGVSTGYAWAKRGRRSTVVPRAAAAPAFARLVPEARPAAPEGAFVVQIGAASIRIEAAFIGELLRGVVAVLGSGSR